ncbi:hypothetical protein [Halorussus ruber]|jgi:hypothetical protein|uniref:hypothetical protein n=1 Tax=Halorussus ruber TaxID=1126238 RepID=UPI001092A8C8|nr:hypothetical protein [Halorussus ruber]
MASIIQNIVDMVGYFSDAAFAFPTSILLMAMGFILVTGSVLVFAYLTAGAVLDLFIPETAGRRPPQQRG